MSLGDILDGIQDNVINIETPEDGNIAAEGVVIMDAKKNSQQFSVQRLSKETLEKVNTMFNLLVLKNNVANMPRVDRGIAMEVFTMLPDIGKVEQAKLTSAPSIINKELMDKVFNANIENKLSLDISDKLYDLKDLIEKHIPMIDVLVTYFHAFTAMVIDKTEIFKNVPPTVVEYKAFVSQEQNQENRLVDLYTEKMDVIIKIDDSKLEYEKYNGVLIGKFYDIYSSATLDDLYNSGIYLPMKNELSLSGLVQYGKTVIENLSNYKDNLQRYYDGLTSIQRQETELNAETIEFINGYDDMAFKLEVIGRLKAITETKDNCFDKTAELIEFLD